MSDKHALPLEVLLDPPFLYAISKNIYVLEMSGGKLLRQYDLRGHTKVTLSQQTLYINATYHPDYTVQAIHADDGTLLWSYPAEGRIADKPFVAGEMVYVSIEDRIDALQASNGALCWSVSFKENAPAYLGPIFFTSPIVSQDVAYIAPAVNKPLKPFVYALHATNGSLIWKAPLDESSSLPLFIEDERLFLSTYTSCLALHTSNGSLLWRYKVSNQTLSSSAVANGRVYIVLENHATPMQQQTVTLLAQQASDGNLLWQRQLEAGSTSSSPVVVSSKVFLSGDDGYLTTLEANDGSLLWRSQVSSARLSSPVATDEEVYVGASDGYVYGLRTGDGTLLWKTYVGTAITASAALSIVVKRGESS